MKKSIILIIAMSLIAASCNSKSGLAKDQVLQIKQYKINVHLADTPQEREVGLGGVSGMADDEGMLFLFSTPQRPQFWMKGMLIPIDIIWISGNKIVAIDDNIKPEPNRSDSQLTRYVPVVDIDKVLEVNAGWIYRHDVAVGDTIQVVGP